MSETPRIVPKPWGREIWWARTDRYVAKILEVKAGHALSRQYHEEKLESLYFRRGSGRIEIDGREIAIEPDLTVTIRPGTIHRIRAETDLEVWEVSTPEVEDVVRLEDDYGRVEVGES